MLDASVLVLNVNYEPLNICNMRRAVLLLLAGKAELLENGNGEIHTAFISFPLPSVIKLGYMVKRPLPKPKLTRREVFLRDRYTCQYCGRETKELTLDHVLPRFRGGGHSWENVVSACTPCNHRKAGSTPREAGMRLHRIPTAPSTNPYRTFYPFLRSHIEWQKFVPLKGE